MPFVDWLRLQISRTDPVGLFARYALKDKIFPKDKAHRLYSLLLRYEHMPEQRKGAKLAHAEWRKIKKQRKEEDVA